MPIPKRSVRVYLRSGVLQKIYNNESGLSRNEYVAGLIYWGLVSGKGMKVIDDWAYEPKYDLSFGISFELEKSIDKYAKARKLTRAKGVERLIELGIVLERRNSK